MTVLILGAITVGSAFSASNPSDKVSATAVVVLLFLFFPALNLGFSGTLGLYISEILTFDMRVNGIAIFSVSQLLFNTINVFGIAVGLSFLTWRLYLVFIGIVLVEIAVVWTIMPETKDIPLEDIKRVFDGWTDDIDEEKEPRFTAIELDSVKASSIRVRMQPQVGIAL